MAEAKHSVIAYVALGSNLGDRAELLRRAVALLREERGICLLACSRIFETDPFGPAPQDDYLNAVVRVRCELSARALLDRLLDIERRCGRDRSGDAPRWGPRVLDLDLLLHGDERIREDGLEVPHPRMHERPFVLVPLAEVAPEVIHPTLSVSLGELARRVGREGVRNFPGELDPDAGSRR